MQSRSISVATDRWSRSTDTTIAQRSFFGAHHETLHSRQRAAIDTDLLPRLKIRPRYHHRIGGDQRPQIVKFRRADRRRRFADAEDLLDPRHL